MVMEMSDILILKIWPFANSMFRTQNCHIIDQHFTNLELISIKIKILTLKAIMTVFLELKITYNFIGIPCTYNVIFLKVFKFALFNGFG